jgi:hypothetical protein
MSKPESVFTVSYEMLVWKVMLDGVLFGNFRSRQNALRGVREARQALVATGRDVSVVINEREKA